jgi:hypothetical protein
MQGHNNNHSAPIVLVSGLRLATDLLLGDDLVESIVMFVSHTDSRLGVLRIDNQSAFARSGKLPKRRELPI